MTRAAIYARVSTDAQAERNTIETQLIYARDFCEARGWSVAGEFVDEGVSGTIALKDRPAGGRLLQAAEDKTFDQLVIYCADRLGRDTVEALLAMDELKRLRIVVEFVRESFDDTDEGRFMFTVMMAAATLEAKRITRRMREGRDRRIEDGAYMSNVIPYGYQKGFKEIENPRTHEKRTIVVLEANHWEAGIVWWIYARCLAGEGIQEIADQLRERGVPVPNHRNEKRRARRWHHTMVYRILTHPRYIGQATYGGLVDAPGKSRKVKDLEKAASMKCPALVDADTQMAAKVALKRRRTHSGPRPRNVYALKGKVFCRRCGNLYYVSSKPKSSKETAKYCCGSRVRWRELAPDHTGVYKTHWPASELEGRVLAFLQRAVREPENLLRKAETYEQCAAGVDVERVREEDRLRASLRSLDAQYERALTAYVRVGGASQVLDAEVARIVRERADTEVQLKGLERSPDARRFEQYAANLRRLARLILHGHAEQGTLLGTPLTPTYPSMHKLLDRVWVEDDGSLIIEGAIPGVIEPPEEARHTGRKLVPPPGATAWRR